MYAKDKRKPIGIFDSGVGGLTVLKEIERVLPQESIIYFGDTARVPYGNKSQKTIIRFSIENVLFLLKKKVKFVVVACNTSSSLALDYLKKVFSIPIVGVIEPAIEKALSVSKKKKIGIIGTRSTIESRVYERLIFKKDNKVRIYSKSCPLFVPLVEEGLTKGKLVDEVVKMYLKELKGKIDTLILACTHYPLLKRAISSYLKGVKIVDSASSVACKVKTMLEELKLKNESGKKFCQFYVSDNPKGFLHLARMFFKRPIELPYLVNDV